MRSLATVAAFLVLGASAAASPPPPPDDEPSNQRPMIEWSTWFRLGYGVEPRYAPTTVARGMTPPQSIGQDTTWEAALGADATLPISDGGNVRIGPWVEARGKTIVGGGELVLTAVPRKLDMFFYQGSGILTLRIGGTTEHGTAALAYGYLAPWNLFRPASGSTRYMIGVRFVASVTRAYEDPGDWKATFGIEFEPIGALRYLLGIRSLY